MGIIIFFTMALFIFIAGVATISITFYHWYKAFKNKKQMEANLES